MEHPQLDKIWPLRSVFGARVWQSLPSSSRQKSFLRRFKRFSEVLRTPPLRRYLDWIGIYNEAGQLALAYKLHRCRTSSYQALPELDANSNAVIIESITLQHEGFTRDEAVQEPAES